MKVIQKDRQSGKTTDLIKESFKTGATIISRDYMMAEITKKIADSMYLEIPNPIPFQKFIVGNYKEDEITSFIVDDIDCILNDIAKNKKVEIITLSTDGWKYEQN